MTMPVEKKLLIGQDSYMLQIVHMAPDVLGKMTSIHRLNNVHTQHIKMPDKNI